MNLEFLIAYYVFAAIIFYPVWRTLRRAGMKGAVAGVVLIPYIGLTVAVAWLALRPWPAMNKEAK